MYLFAPIKAILAPPDEVNFWQRLKLLLHPPIYPTPSLHPVRTLLPPAPADHHEQSLPDDLTLVDSARNKPREHTYPPDTSSTRTGRDSATENDEELPQKQNAGGAMDRDGPPGLGDECGQEEAVSRAGSPLSPVSRVSLTILASAMVPLNNSEQAHSPRDIPRWLYDMETGDAEEAIDFLCSGVSPRTSTQEPRFLRF